MSPPIFTPDGSEVSEIVLPDGSTASEVIGPDGNVVFEAGGDIPDSGISRWQYEDDSDTSIAVDSWGNNDGSISGATYTTNSIVGTNALDFDPANSPVVDFGDIPEADNVGQFTFSTWYRPQNVSTFQYILGKGEPASGVGYNLNLTDTNVIRLKYDDGSVNTITGSTLSTGTEFMLTGVFDLNNGESRLYTNDVRDATGTLSNAVTSTTEPLRHSWNVGGFDYINGVGDDVRIYSKALTDTEVSNLYNTGSISA